MTSLSFNLLREFAEDIREEFCDSDAERLHREVQSSPIVLVYGQSCHAKALFVNNLLGQQILPLYSSKWRWVIFFSNITAQNPFIPLFKVKFSHGQVRTVRLTLGCEYEIVESLKADQQPWTTIPEADLQRGFNECSLDQCLSIEVTLCHPVFRENLRCFIPPDSLPEQIPGMLKNIENTLPVIVYAITEEILNDTVSEFLWSKFEVEGARCRM